MSLNFRIAFLSTLGAVLIAACGSAPPQSWSGLSHNPESNTIYVTRDTHVYALTSNGTKQWQFPLDNDTATGPFYADPVLYEGTLIVTSFNKSVYALNASDGTLTWSYPKPSESAGFTFPWQTNPDAPTDRLIGSVAVDENSIYVPSADGSLYTLDHQGNLKWKFTTGESLWGAPLPVGDILYVPSMDHTLYAVDAATGTQLWASPLNGAMAGSPALSPDGKTIYAGSLSNTLYALDAETGAQQWTVPADGWVWGTPLVTEDTLYFGDMYGSVFAVEAASGEVKWKVQPGSRIRATPVLSGETIIVPTDNGIVYSLSIADGSKQWEKELDSQNADRLMATVVLMDGKVLIAPLAAENLIYALNVNTGEVAWTFKP